MKQSQALRNLSLAQERKREIEGIAGLGLTGVVLGLGVITLSIILGVMVAQTWGFLGVPGAISVILGVACYYKVHATHQINDPEGVDSGYGRKYLDVSEIEYARILLARAEQDLEDAE